MLSRSLRFIRFGQFGMFAALCGFLGPSWAHGDDVLPYDTRTRPYGGFTTPAHGDIRTVGMAGATAGLADTYLAAVDNPAGLAMALKDADTNFTADHIHNSQIQNYDNAYLNSNYGAALNLYPWGFSLGYVQPYREGQRYVLPAAGNPSANLDITIREFDVAVGRILAKDWLAAGAQLTIGQGEEEIDVGDSSNAFHSYSVGATFGLLAQLRRRVLIGLSYATAMHYGTDGAGSSPAIDGFYQPIQVPSRWNLGVGWIPNAYFRMDANLSLIGSTPDAGLLRDQNVTTGYRATWQPRLGFAYMPVDFKEFQATVYLGAYYEMTRIENTDSRAHITSGIEFKPWVLTLGWGIDQANGYKNFLFGIGVDLVKLGEKLDIIPPLPHPSRPGFFPDPTHFGNTGLPRALTHNYADEGTGINPIEIGLSIPKRIEQKFTGTPVPPPPEPKKHSKTAKKKKKKRKRKKIKKPKS